MPIRQQTANSTRSTHTIVAPTGVEARMDRKMPRAAPKTDRKAEAPMTPRKLLKIRMADSAGKIISAEIRRDPTSFMASTITDAVCTAIRRLERWVGAPVGGALGASRVTA